MTAIFLSALEADEILATRENLESSVRMSDGPEARRVPESLCVEIDQLLYLLELAVRDEVDVPES